jgi:hypothetical protein
MVVRKLFNVAMISLAASPAAFAEDPVIWASGDEAMSSFEAVEPLAGDEERMVFDDQVTPVQAATRSGSGRTFASRTSSRAGRTSRIPYMIGDSPSGHSSGLGATIGFEGIELAEAEHPILGGGRFNAAENAISFPTDRIYANYRHFSEANDVVFAGRQTSLPIDRLDVGFEKTVFDGVSSIELRVPVVRQLDSDLSLFGDASGANLSDIRHGELGNIGVNFKVLLVSRGTFGVSGGVGVSCPTGEDAYIDLEVDDPDVVITPSPLVSTTSPTNISFIGQFDNDTVNLVPYIAWFVRPGRFFHQGFLQVDAPLNRSDASIAVDGEITPDSTYGAETFSVVQTGELDQQTLLRANAGFGYWLSYGGDGMLRGLAGLFEIHYTSALDNANPFVVPVTTLIGTGEDIPINVAAGPRSNDIDIVNLTAGLVADLGSCQVTNGFIVPVTDDEERQFDFEYSLMLNRRY